MYIFFLWIIAKNKELSTEYIRRFYTQVLFLGKVIICINSIFTQNVFVYPMTSLIISNAVQENKNKNLMKTTR